MHSARRSPGIAPAATPEIAILAPTRLEAWAVQRCVNRATPVIRSGVGGSASSDAAAVIVCGLAGSLSNDLPPGSVIVPRSVGLPSGASSDCDAQLQSIFLRAARELGFEASSQPLLTFPSMLTGSARACWRERGFAAVDMESALAAAPTARLAVVRVILDAPGHEISSQWLRPLTIMLRPWLWLQALRLAWDAPRYAMRAARIVAYGLAMLRA